MGIDWEEFFKSLAIAAVMVIIIGLLIGTCVKVANAKEPTTLEDALERPVVVQKYVDEANDVVCYWVDRRPQYLSCLQIRGLDHRERDAK